MSRIFDRVYLSLSIGCFGDIALALLLALHASLDLSELALASQELLSLLGNFALYLDLDLTELLLLTAELFLLEADGLRGKVFRVHSRIVATAYS